MKAADTTEQVHESHRNYFRATVLKVNGGVVVELDVILARLAEQVAKVDKSITPTQPIYIPSIGSSSEPVIVRRMVEEWSKQYPHELQNVVLEKRGNNSEGCFEINYPNNKRHKLDFGFSSSTAPDGMDNLQNLEWVIEFKKINWCGDTGTDQSERAVGKLCSPYPSTGPILEDALRVTKHTYGSRCAVILLSPDVLPDQLQKCEAHPDRKKRWYPDRENDRLIALTNSFTKNNGYAFEAEPLLPFVERIFEYKGINHTDRIIHKIKGLTSHPVYSRLTLVGWEIIR